MIMTIGLTVQIQIEVKRSEDQVKMKWTTTG